MSQDVDKFLFGGGGKSAKFEAMGDMVSGVITSAEVKQQTSMEDNTPLTWSNGDPRMQLVIKLQTEDKVDEDDDGIRALYAKGGDFEIAEGQGKSMKSAIADAVKKANASTIVEGGTLKVAYTGEGKKTSRGYSAPKLFTAKYTPPVAGVEAKDLFDD